MSENIIESNEISVGKYEILFSSLRHEEYGYETMVQYLNNACVKVGEINLKYRIDWKEKGKSINSIRFLMPRDEAKLSDVFYTTPYGLIKKNRTGVGATTLELNSPRNSIIVVPLKAIAYNKARVSKIEDTDKYRVLYVGGSISGFRVPSIREYLSDSSIPIKKFIVVADSLPRLLDEIGIENCKNYFFMVDEVDSFQYDSSYRESLERVIDYYFEFPPCQRCLVSATIGNFSNKKIEEEPVIEVRFNEPQPRNIELLHTNNVIRVATKKIEEKLEQYPNDKVLIAFNSVKGGILQIIEGLDESLKNRCAVLCSIKSKPYVGEYYSDILDEQLPNQITFMTSSYFVGIDISERFHLISIAESDQPYTLLSKDKFQQIAGRCRHPEGLSSKTIIYQSKESSTASSNTSNSNFTLNNTTLERLERNILEDSLSLVNLLNSIPQLHTFKKLENMLNRIDIDAVIKDSSQSYYGIHGIRLIRRDIHGNIQPAYLNIDNILIQVNLLNVLYSTKTNLYQSLRQSENVFSYQDIQEEEQRITVEDQEAIDENIRTVEQNEIVTIIEQLRSVGTIEERMRIANRLKMTSTKQGEIFITRLMELQDYVPLELLVQNNLQDKSPTEYNKFYNSVMFWALSEDHSFKIAFKDKFSLNTSLSNEEIRIRLNDLLMSNLDFKTIESTGTAIRYLGLFCKRSDSNNRIRDRARGNLYTILSYDVNDFGTPLKRIEANTRVSDIFKFPKSVLRS